MAAESSDAIALRLRSKKRVIESYTMPSTSLPRQRSLRRVTLASVAELKLASVPKLTLPQPSGTTKQLPTQQQLLALDGDVTDVVHNILSYNRHMASDDDYKTLVLVAVVSTATCGNPSCRIITLSKALDVLEIPEVKNIMDSKKYAPGSGFEWAQNAHHWSALKRTWELSPDNVPNIRDPEDLFTAGVQLDLFGFADHDILALKRCLCSSPRPAS